MQNVLSRVTRYSIYVLVFMVPLFWLPFSFEALEYNKQYLLFFLVSLGFFAWLAKMVVYDKEIKFRTSPLDLFVLGFLAVGVLSAVLSVDRGSSLFGFYGRFSTSLIGLLSLGALYFLVTNNVGTKLKSQISNLKTTTQNLKPIDISSLLSLLLWSSGLVVLVGYLSVFGVWAKINSLVALPPIMLQQTFNLTVGSLEGLAIFLAVVVVLLVGIFLTQNSNLQSQNHNSKLKTFIYYLLFLASLGLMVLIDFTWVWVVVLVNLALVAGFSIWKRMFRENVNRLLIPIFLIVVAAGLIFYNPNIINLPKEQVMSQPVSWQTAAGSTISGVKSGFLGSGPGTFYYDFAKHKPLSVNESWLWQIRFDRAGSHLAEMLATLGFLGILSYLSMIGVFLWVSYLLISNLKSQISNLLLPLLAVFLVLLAGQAVYYQNTTLAFLFWLVLAMAVVSWGKPIKEKIVSFKDFPELSLVFSTSVIIVGVAFLALYFYGVKYYLADVKYSQAFSVLGEQRVDKLEEAVIWNPRQPNYRITLARTYLSTALAEMAKAQSEQDTAKIQLRVSGAIDQARAATVLQPSFVANWQITGLIYSQIGGVAVGAVDWGVDSFKKAIELEPTNPALYTELGKLYALTGNTEKAKENYSRALEKKSNYADALIQEALLLETEENINEAISRLETLVQNNPLHVEASFQLGRLYFNNGRIDEAINLFRIVVILAPGHSNAHYALGVAYVARGENNLAIEAFEKVLEMNPDHQDVMQKLEELRP